MKKLLLSLVAVAFTATASWADVTTLNFEGNDNLFGLTRYTSAKEADLTFVQEVSHTQDGVDFKITNTLETATGFALINAGSSLYGEQNGLAVYSSGFSASGGKWVNPNIVITVPGGKISEVKLYISGASTNAMSIYVGEGTTTTLPDPTSISAGYNCYSWSGDSETLNLHWENKFSVRYIHKIEVTYTPDLGGKEECGLSFSAATADGVVGEAFTGPELSNPHGLALSWSSSDENVATVDEDGKVTLVGGGTAVITVSTEGDDTYAPGNARYTVTVMPAATNIAQLYAVAPAQNDLVKVNFPMIVTYATGSNAYVKDGEGNATLIHNTKNDNNSSTGASAAIYKVGDIIPEGWIATNKGVDGFSGQPADVTETTEVIYPEVESISYETDANKVVTLMDVTFETATNATDKTYGTTPDGTTYEFQNTFNIADSPAGTYNATVVVKSNKIGTHVYSWLAPIEFANDPVFPETLDVKLSSNCEALKLKQGEEDGVYAIYVNGECDEKEVTVTIEIPEGWTGLIGITDDDYTPDVNNEPPRAKAVAASDIDDEAEWTPISELKAMMEGVKEGNVFTFPVDGDLHRGSFYLYKDEMAYMTQQIQLEFEVVYNVEAGINSIEAADSDARYFNLQGVEVKNPETGVYVKVSNGKVSKVTVK